MLTAVSAMMDVNHGMAAMATASSAMPASTWSRRSTRSASFPNSGLVSAMESTCRENTSPIW